MIWLLLALVLVALGLGGWSVRWGLLLWHEIGRLQGRVYDLEQQRGLGVPEHFNCRCGVQRNTEERRCDESD